MTAKTTFADDDAPKRTAEELEVAIDELEYKGRRLAEELETLQKHDAWHAAQIVHHEVELVAAQDALAKLPADATAGETYRAKLAVVTAELNVGEFAEQRSELQKELEATPKLIADNVKAIKAARAAL
jgi:hypothetical protein